MSMWVGGCQAPPQKNKQPNTDVPAGKGTARHAHGHWKRKACHAPGTFKNLVLTSWGSKACPTQTQEFERAILRKEKVGPAEQGFVGWGPAKPKAPYWEAALCSEVSKRARHRASCQIGAGKPDPPVLCGTQAAYHPGMFLQKCH